MIKDFNFCNVLVKFIANMHDLFTPLRDKKGIIITNAFQKFLNESKRKPNKISVGFKWIKMQTKQTMGRQRQWILQLFLQNNGIEMYSTHNNRKSVDAERFIRTLKIKCMNTRLHLQIMCILINKII